MRTTLIALAAAGGLALAGCGGDETATTEKAPSASPSPSASDRPSSSPSASESPSVAVQLQDKGARQTIEIRGDSITPSGKRVDLGLGERLSLTVSSDRAGELHVHSSPEQELQYRRGSTALDVFFESPGIVEVEDHQAGVVILRIYVS